MSALLVPRPGEQHSLFDDERRPEPEPEPRRVSAAPDGPTLEDVIARAWETLSAGTSATCPVCQGPLEPRWSAGAGAVGGRCRDCDAALG